MAALSEWLQIMLSEIARKRDDADRARDEDTKRHSESKPAMSPNDDATSRAVLESVRLGKRA
jgi:hypothetical protein